MTNGVMNGATTEVAISVAPSGNWLRSGAESHVKMSLAK